MSNKEVYTFIHFYHILISPLFFFFQRPTLSNKPNKLCVNCISLMVIDQNGDRKKGYINVNKRDLEEESSRRVLLHKYNIKIKF